MFDTAFVAGSTGKSVYLRAQVISTGLPYTGGAFNTPTISAQYCRNTFAAVAITLVTQTAGGAWASGGLVHIGKGRYRLDIPNAALLAGVDYVTYDIDGIADVIWVGGKSEITGSDPRAAVSADVNVVSMAANTVTASAVAADAVTELQSGLATTAALSTAQTAITAIKGQTDQMIFTGGLNVNVIAMAANTLNATALAADAVTEMQAGLATATALTTVANKTNGLNFVGANLLTDMRAINGTVLTGDGSTGTPWGP